MADSNFNIEGLGRVRLIHDITSIATMLMTIRDLTNMDEGTDQVFGAIQALSEKAGYLSDAWLDRIDGGRQVCGNYDDWIGVSDEGKCVS